MNDLLKKAHALCSRNKDILRISERCGCFYCLNIFSFDKITRWIDSEKNTAICPYCGIDSVIPQSDLYELDKGFLGEMHQYWFCS